ncbi:hypothetical protein P152DRAFT_460470 [Eremomyces bilateralis CBS 781.70]|uniref:S-adenosyl-L-methionine-dependent tRNA 4-demethylwyosine synthase n=1 Tax=Eremomyces bilateralis CBS 781.70 TaxID=1392243 RepID=A0A6G1FX88_9PEZI|nr:uncharacterized protein P152DRAFT_460470 [Eremomyces bilateralis CBS 781.70]KAF1810358.1 hypothetical protein P152DRAFT_460470 [Eremomyces bilateralis CBS 781.70]
MDIAPEFPAWPFELLELWHENRLNLLAAIVIVGLAVRLISWKRETIKETRPKETTQLHNEKISSGETSRRVLENRLPKRVTGVRQSKPARDASITGIRAIQLHVFYFSLTTTTEKTAKRVQQELDEWSGKPSSAGGPDCDVSVVLYDLSEIEYDDFFVSPPRHTESTTKSFYLMLIPSYNIDTVMDTFIEQLKETHHDFRIDTASLSGLLGYSVFGIGDREGWPTESEGFCCQAIEVDKWLARLTGQKRAYPMGLGDAKSDATERLQEWVQGIERAVRDIFLAGGLGEGVSGSGEALESGDEDDEIMDPKKNPSKRRRAERIDDMEDLDRMIQKDASDDAPLAIDFTTYGKSKPGPPIVERKEMVPKSSPTYAALTKQGYTIVGSHSGVKICRWTKSALRGRGSCYKYSFYGIKSHLCMETTPALSCSNKCVFCWRHGTNPVGTTWRWKIDPPELIFEGVKAGHYKKMKMMKGVPGVRAERFEESMRIRHCALSLVGEPIFYPHINEFTAMLHKEHISSFLVCNAQHPDELAALKPITQLYVSIDASNKESLRKVDRPLHRDFWERLMRCLDILRERRFRQRTVFRLTLVKGFNIEDEAEGYADLVEKGLPCFVEIKGVTYCGTSTSASAGLTMQNVPFYEEVTEFVVQLNAALERRGLKYGIAAEHAHSCCVLLASTRFHIDGKWHSTIDYDKFFECLESGKEFGPEDYIGPPTPEWATWGNGGFNPEDTRVFRKGKNKTIQQTVEI